MRYIFNLLIVVFVPFFAFTQNTTPFTEYPLPQFTLKLSDGSNYTKANIPKGKQVLVMLFSPDCDHCQKETETIKANIKDFKNTHILMITSQSIEKMVGFYKDYDLAKYKEITVGQDAKFFFPTYYKIKFFPYLVMYDKKDKYVKHFEGNPKWEDLKALLK